MAATTEPIPTSPLALPLSVRIYFPNPMTASSDLTEIDLHAYMESSGFYNSVDEAFARLKAEIKAEFDALSAHINQLFDELIAE